VGDAGAEHARAGAENAGRSWCYFGTISGGFRETIYAAVMPVCTNTNSCASRRKRVGDAGAEHARAGAENAGQRWCYFGGISR